MSQVSKIDSNFTGLRYAFETSPGVVATDAIWLPLEPNDYKDFGGDYKTKARNPINPSRQRKKGVITDLDASGGFSQDITAFNMQDILQSFFFAHLRRKHEVAVPTVDGTANEYVPASGGDAYVAGDMLFAKGFTFTANNGLKDVSGTPGASTLTVSDTGLVDEGGSAGIVSYVGHKFGATAVSVDVSGNYPILVGTSVAASKVLTMSGVFVDTETVSIGGVTYTAQDTLTNVAGHFKIGVDLASTLLNLRNAVNRNGIGTPGTDFAVLCVANPLVSATCDATHLTVTARTSGPSGNAVVIGETLTNGSWAGAATALSGGAGYSFKSLGLIPGEDIFVGGDTDGTDAFTTPANNGYCRVRSVDNNAIILDKTQFTMVTDAGTGVSLRIFVGRALKNEVDQALIVSVPVQLERLLGAPDDASPSQIQSEYVTNGLGDELTISVKTGDILTAEMAFMGGQHELRTGATGPKPGTRPNVVEADAFNATSDVSLLKVAIVDDADSSPDPIVGYMTDIKLTLKNNLKQNKAISVLGAIGVSAGTFEVALSITAYLSNVTAIASVRDNVNATTEIHFSKANKGFSMDFPLLALGKARADVKQDEAVMLPMSMDAATASLIDPTLDHTFFITFFDYLPDAAS
jgi:hypothetical protein